MRWVQKTDVKLFRLSFSAGSPSRKTRSKRVESNKPFFDCCVRPFLIQSDLSVENGQISFLTQSKKGFFDSTLDLSAKKLSRKSFTPV